MLVSVIVPVYGVESFVERCMESILAQTWKDMEVIVVNDCTQDNSMDIINSVINRYPQRANSVRIINHDVNRGLPAARNTGLVAAKGEYVFHFDGDDYADPEMITRMVSVAKANCADIVYCDWFLAYEDTDRYMSQPACNTASDAIVSILTGKMKYNVWNKLINRRLYEENGIEFPEGYGMGEDMTMIKLFSVANKIAYIPEAFYHYVKTNSNAMTESVSDRALQEIDYNVSSTLSFLENRISRHEYLSSIFKLSVKYPLLFSKSSIQYTHWSERYVEANKYATDKVFGVHTRLVQWLAVHQFYFGLKVHFYLYSLLYRIVYRRK